MTGKKLRDLLEHGYMLAVCAFLLWNIAYMTEAQWTFDVRGVFPAVWLGLAALALLMQRFRPGAGGLLLALTGWMAISSAARGGEVMAVQLPQLARALLAFGVVLPAARVVRQERFIRYMRWLMALWMAFLTAQAALGLWAALTGHAVFSLKGTWYIGVNLGDNRLYLNAFVTVGAVKQGLSVLLAALGLAISRRGVPKVLYGLCMLVQLACLSLTDCRTAFIAVGAGLGLMLAVVLLHKLPSGNARRRRLRRGMALAAIPLLMLSAYAGLSGLLTALSPHVPHELDNLTLLEIPAHLLPEAAAEGAVQHRELAAENLFNNRQVIWRAALRLLKYEPRLLLTGTTTALSPVMTNLCIRPGEYAGMPFAHVHNIYLQTLVSWGLPGLVLLAAFLVVFLRSAWRVMARHALPVWQRLVPVPVLFVLLCETVDCFTRLSEDSPLLLFACLFAGLTLEIDRRARREAFAARACPAPVDVIIPVYNAADYVARAAESALQCEGTRVILVDDGSTDGSGAVCDRLAADPRVQVLHQPNRGASAARNTGLASATADYVAFLDADDMLLPGALAALMSNMDGAEAIQGRIVRGMPETYHHPKTYLCLIAEALPQTLGDPTRHLLCHGWLFRRSLLTERFNESLTMGEDGEWLLRTLAKANRAAFCETPVYRYTVRADSALHGGGTDVTQAYMNTLAAAEPALEALQMPQEAALYRLTHLLLLLTHGDLSQMQRLRASAPFAEAFDCARLRGFSPRMVTLRLLKRRAFRLAGLAVRIRRALNRCSESS